MDEQRVIDEAEQRVLDAYRAYRVAWRSQKASWLRATANYTWPEGSSLDLSSLAANEMVKLMQVAAEGAKAEPR